MFRARIRIVLFSLFYVSPERDSLCFRIFCFSSFLLGCFHGVFRDDNVFHKRNDCGREDNRYFFLNIIVLGHYYDVSRKKNRIFHSNQHTKRRRVGYKLGAYFCFFLFVNELYQFG